MRKNVVGNIAFGFIAGAFNPLGGGVTPSIQVGYNKAPVYGGHQGDETKYGMFYLAQRADSLVAFGVGVTLATDNFSDLTQFTADLAHDIRASAY